ncbi:MAG: hypothetical protein P4L69_16385 [Desulfosporosinus sp.]|nr:hypothetical protein [Desulfosporosinus sp.]
MKMQNEMVESFLSGHHNFIVNLNYSLDMIEKDINETAEMEALCTSEWCVAVEHCLDEVANGVYSISEPRWTSKEKSREFRNVRRRVHDLYAQYRGSAHA